MDLKNLSPDHTNPSCDTTAKSHDHSFEVLQKSKIGNFSVVTLRAATLKIPDLVFFAIHPKLLIGTFGSRVHRKFRSANMVEFHNNELKNGQDVL